MAGLRGSASRTVACIAGLCLLGACFASRGPDDGGAGAAPGGGSSAEGRQGVGGADAAATSSVRTTTDVDAEPDWQTYFRDLCDFYERCNSPLANLYGTGTECLEAYEFVAETFTRYPEYREQHARRAACSAGFRTVACPPDDGARFGVIDVRHEALDGCIGGLAGEGETCGADLGCEGDLVCFRWDENQCGVCTQHASVSCEYTSDCGTWYCADGSCTPRRDLGEACASPAECRTGRCTGTCTRGDVGQPCDRTLPCDPYLVCRDGACTLPGSEGDACDPGIFNCRMPLACHHGTCVPQAPLDNPVGGPCSSNERCVAGSHCDEGECVAQPTLGESCVQVTGPPCAAGSYCKLIDPILDLFIGTCEPTKADGAECAEARECEANNCFEDRCRSRVTCAP